MERAVANVGNGKKHVVGQFALETNVPALSVRDFAWISAKLPQSAGGIQEATIRKAYGAGLRNRVAIPLAEARGI